uniref:Uncharacterized protein n=1 Tax=Steinernema glaseri TaxID=37863 RepID=A0A1I8ACG2_9BILA
MFAPDPSYQSQSISSPGTLRARCHPPALVQLRALQAAYLASDRVDSFSPSFPPPPLPPRTSRIGVPADCSWKNK